MSNRSVSIALVLVLLMTSVFALAAARPVAASMGPAQAPVGPQLAMPVPVGAPAASSVTTSGDIGWSQPTALMTTSTSSANLAGVALGRDGTGMVLWQKAGARYNMFATHFVPNGGGDAGTDWQVPVQLSTGEYDAYYAYGSSIAMDGYGDALAVYYSWNVTHGYAAYAVLYTAGQGWSSPVSIDQRYGYSYLPVVAMDYNGDAVAAWMVWDGARYDIFANRFSWGVGWGTAVQIDGTNNNTYYPRVAMDDSGNAIVAWQQYDSTYHVMAARFSTSSGWLAPILLETSSAYAVYPTVAMDSEGNGIVAWIEYDGIYNVWAKRYDNTTGWETAVNIESSAYSALYSQPSVAASNGNATVVWEMQDGTTVQNVYANRYVAGTGWVGEVEVDGTSAPAYNGQVTIDSTGNVTVTYQYAPPNTNPANLVINEAVRYDHVTSSWGYSQLDYSRAGMGSPIVAGDGSGDTFAVWNFNENPTTAPSPRYGLLTNYYTAGSGWWPYWQDQLAEWGAQFSIGWPQLESNAAGDAIYSWTQSDGPIWRGYAALYKPGLGWGPAVRIENLNMSSIGEEWSAIDASGNALVIFRINDGTGWAVYGVYYSASTGWGSPHRIDTRPDDNFWLRVAMSATGDGMAVYDEWNGTNWNVMASRFDGAAHTWSAPVKLQTTSVYVGSDGVAMDASGDAMVAYQAWDGSTYSIYAVKYTAGSSWSAPVLIEQSGLEAGSPAIGMGSNGAAAVSWSWWSGSFWEAAGTTYDPSTGWSPTATYETSAGDSYTAVPSVDGSGNAMIAYQVFENGKWDVYSAAHPSGGSWSAPVLLNAGAGDAVDIVTALNYHGDGYAVWNQFNGVTWDVLARRYVAGSGWMPVTLLNTLQTNSGSTLATVDGAGNGLVGWNQYSNNVLIPFSDSYTVGDGLPRLTVSSPSEGVLTNNPSVTLSGSTDPGRSVTVDGSAVTVAADGSFRATVSLADGPHTFVVTAEDAAGQATTVRRSITVDTQAPSLSITSPASGTLSDHAITVVQGTTEPGASVVIDGVEAAVSSSGAFSVPLPLSEGVNNITATATDAAGNQAHASVTVTLDTTPPAIAITSPREGANETSPTVTVTGTTEPGATVVVNGQTVTVDASGSFSVQLSLSEGGNLITATATDAAGNRATTDIVVTYANPAQAAAVQSSIASLSTMNLLLIVLVVVSLALGAFEMIQIRKLRRAKPPQQKPEGGAPPTEEL